MVSVLSNSQSRLVESRHRLAISAERLATSLYRCTRRRSIRGASDESANGSARCSHEGAVELPTRGDYQEACEERDAFVVEANGYYVSPVRRLAGGLWGWTVCPACQ